MRDFIEHFIAEQRTNGFAAFRGAALEGSIPVRQEVINDLIQQTVLNNDGVIKEIRLTVHDQNRVDVALTVRTFGLSRQINLELRVEPEMHFPDAPKLKIWVAKAPWYLASVAKLAEWLGFVPGVVRIADRLIEVDLKMLLWQQKLGDLTPLIKFAEIATQAGLIVIHFRLAVD